LAEGQEIRNFIRRQKSPIDFVSQTSVRPQRLGAVLTSRPFLCGLSDTEWNVVRERARTALHPEQAQMQQSLTKALDELRLGVAATRRMLMERCEIGEDDDGPVRLVS
jgi:hypothetical protein